MTALDAIEAFAAYFVIGVILALAVLTAWVNHYGGDALCLLDRTRLQSVLDDRDRGVLVDRALAEDREVAWLDELWYLPARDPRS